MLNATTNRRSQARWIILFSGLMILMFGLGYALAPVTDYSCEHLGIGCPSTIAVEQHDSSDIAIQADRGITVEFAATENEDMPWTMKPVVRTTKVHPGEIHLVNYLVTNTSNESMVGQAIPSVLPMEAMKNLVKLECFCFSNQTLAAGEAREMPVRFYVNSDLPETIDKLTLSYIFYPVSQSTAAHGEHTSG